MKTSKCVHQSTDINRIPMIMLWLCFCLNFQLKSNVFRNTVHCCILNKFLLIISFSLFFLNKIFFLKVTHLNRHIRANRQRLCNRFIRYTYVRNGHSSLNVPISRLNKSLFWRFVKLTIVLSIDGVYIYIHYFDTVVQSEFPLVSEV